MSNRDAMRSVMARVPAANVQFVDPVLSMFFDDERAGLCDIEIKRLGPFVQPDVSLLGTVAQHEVHVSYHDPEIEFEKRLSI
jgi:hypothetical protein